MTTREEKIAKFVEKYGEEKHIKEQDFYPDPISKKDRIDMQEECILELAEIIGGMI